jgi:cytochrome c-type biogenesis protein CcmH/NrfG
VTDQERASTTALEAERDFLLRSLDDLDAEREAGNIDDHTYRVLYDDYTARAAAALRSLDEGVDLTPADPPGPSRTKRFVTVGGIVVFAVAAAFFLSSAVGQRRSGDTITGNAGASSTATTANPTAALAQAVEKNPNSYGARIAYARALLGASDAKGAIEQYDAAAKLDPKQPEPLAYGGWIRALVAQELPASADRDLLVRSALDRFEQATAAKPDYADAYVFKGLTLLNIANDPAGAVRAFQQFLVLAPPDHPMREQVLSVLREATAAAGPTTTSPTTTPRP